MGLLEDRGSALSKRLSQNPPWLCVPLELRVPPTPLGAFVQIRERALSCRGDAACSRTPDFASCTWLHSASMELLVGALHVH